MDALFAFLQGILPRGAGDAVGVFVSAVLTVMVFTYIIGDNLFFRIAQHVLIGAVAAYAVVVALHQVLLGQLLIPLVARTSVEWPLIVPLVLGVMLLAKATPNTAWFGNVPVGFMLGVGAALGISGALLGTLLPQLTATAISLLDRAGPDLSLPQRLAQLFSNALIIIGALGALLSFQFVRGGNRRAAVEAQPAAEGDAGASRRTARLPWRGVLAGRWQDIARAFSRVVSLWSALGRGFIWIAFGALFAGLALSRITLLVSRVQFLLDAFKLSVR